MNTTETLQLMISQEFDIDINTITADSKIQGDLNLDSVDLISLVASIEIKFSIELNEETLLPIETLQQLADIIDQNINHA
jgi:acyl carrier protein